MGDVHLYLLSQGEHGLLHQVAEENDALEDGFVGLLEELLLVAGWQVVHELRLLLHVELLPNVH